ncbi:endonuclease III [Candidatus Thorarchaeota archaeon]|nr:MAG: endonuclease III [Candidatus Thorarchaeota archaeon]
MSVTKRAQRICDILIEEYGNEIATRRLPPVDELIVTILSQNTADVNTSRAFARLNEKFSNWEELLEAPDEEIEDAIRVSGFFRIKTERIKAALSEIRERVGALDLSHLEEMPLAEAKEWLTSLHGVGPKTAAIVLLFSFGRPALPVDTHVWRVTKRLGLIDGDTSREKAHELLEDIIPKSCIFSLNHNLVTHGRNICRARRPLCEQCVLRQDCDYFRSQN